MAFHSQFDCYRGYLNSIGESKVLQYAVSSTVLLHVLLCYVMTVQLNLGVMGVSFSTMITIICNNLFVTIYSWKVNEYSVSPLPYNYRTLLTPSEVGVYLGISLPSILMLLAEWASVEILIMMSASISMGAVSAMSISYTYHNLVYQFPYGF